MKLLTFLGIGRYEKTTYVWGNHECTTPFAPAASYQFLKPDELIVFLTEEAEEKIYPGFQETLPSGLIVRPVPVSLGKNEAELWGIFAQVSKAVQPGETVAFDVTHGLRSFPLIGLLAAAFLRSGLDVDLKAVIYGAYDVRDNSVTPNRTPMFDLSPMLSLLEWASAADRFKRNGDARSLAQLLKQQQKDLAVLSQGDKDILTNAGRLGGLADDLGNVSEGLHLIRPHQVMQHAASLEKRVEQARPVLEQVAAAGPFSLVLNDVAQAYAPLAYATPRQDGDIHQTLAVERTLIHWYKERHLWMQAVSLAREWLVSWMMVQLGLTNLTQHSARQRVENVMGGEASEFKKAREKKRPYLPVFLSFLPELENMLSLWSTLGDVRNDIDHAGMRDNPLEPAALIKQICQCIDQIDTLTI